VIKAIIFDYFGVISSDDYWQFVKADKNMENDFHQLANDVNTGKISWQELVDETAAKIGKSTHEVDAMFAQQRINPAMLALVAKLHKSYKTALLTNANHEFLEPIIKEAGLAELFDVITMSSHVGVTKPAAPIFHHTLERLGVQPSEAVFIDDVKRNAEGAKALGMQAIYYQNFEQMESDLEKILAK
jgi:putative hydrolase of the HAD superfamily